LEVQLPSGKPHTAAAAASKRTSRSHAVMTVLLGPLLGR
jgi:hypothetical protein